MEIDRRLYPRLVAPVYFRPLGLRLFEGKRRTVDISLGGARIYCDEKIKIGTRLELELFLPDSTSLRRSAEVVWMEELPEGSPARYDVGLRFIEILPGDAERLSSVLKSEG